MGRGGFAVSPVDPSTIGLYSEGVRLLDDRPCLRCGYNIRGLMDTGICPECGSPVRDSLRGNLLRYASPEYVARLERGARLVWWSIAVVLLMIIVGVAISAMAAGMGGPGGPVWGGTAIGSLFALVMLASSALGLFGWWMLSTRDPADQRDSAANSRQVLRATLVISAACALVNFALGATTGGPGFNPPRGVGPGGPTPFSAAAMAAGLASLLTNLAWLVQFYASMLYLRTLAPRIPDDRISRRAKALMWAAPVLVVIGILTFVVALAGGMAAGGGMALVLMMIPTCVVGVGFLVVVVMYIFLIDRLHRSLKAVRAEVESLAAG